MGMTTIRYVKPKHLNRPVFCSLKDEPDVIGVITSENFDDGNDVDVAWITPNYERTGAISRDLISVFDYDSITIECR
jgi:hypothetical protein